MTEPTLETPPMRLSPPAQQVHPAALDFVGKWSDTMRELEALRLRNAELEADLALERRYSADLRSDNDHMRSLMHRYQAYCVGIRTRMDDIVDMIGRAKDEAVKSAVDAPVPPPPTPPETSRVEEATDEIREAADEVERGLREIHARERASEAGQ